MSDALSEYMRFIDGLVATREAGLARRVRQGEWHEQRTSDPVKVGDFIASLSPEQREVLAQIIQGAADAAIHDALLFVADQGYRLGREGVELPVKPFGAEMHQDFRTRRDGDEWPRRKPE